MMHPFKQTHEMRMAEASRFGLVLSAISLALFFLILIIIGGDGP
jgi:hypothetical protein